MRVSLLPSPSTTAKLFGIGATVGPLVDSLHNQSLLTYRIAPITVEWPMGAPQFLLQHQDHLFCSSWLVPPLLGIAYVVLGGILPRLFESVVGSGTPIAATTTTDNHYDRKALLAVLSTAGIILLSDVLVTLTTTGSSEQHVLVLLAVALCQWAWLDGTLAALLAASLTSLGGPLSELPFVAAGVWEYLPSVADYVPWNGEWWALSSITGPCYFAVTMDAIALGRWLDDESAE